MASVLVKNAFSKAIRVGRKVIAPGQVEPIDEAFLYTPRVQRLKKRERLVWPYREKEDTEPVAEIGPVSESEQEPDIVSSIDEDLEEDEG